MQKKEEVEEKTKGKKRKPYLKPSFTVEELFEATVLACLKRRQTGCALGSRRRS